MFQAFMPRLATEHISVRKCAQLDRCVCVCETESSDQLIYIT